MAERREVVKVNVQLERSSNEDESVSQQRRAGSENWPIAAGFPSEVVEMFCHKFGSFNG